MALVIRSWTKRLRLLFQERKKKEEKKKRLWDYIERSGSREGGFFLRFFSSRQNLRFRFLLPLGLIINKVLPFSLSLSL